MRFLKPTRLRLYSQIFFFALFLLLLLRTEFRGSLSSSAHEIRLPYPVGLFFRLDPLVAISNALASHALYKGLLVSLIILIPTLLFRALLLRMDLPAGLHSPFLRKLEIGAQARQATDGSNRYKRWQNTKYYLLAAVLVAAALGTGIVGWLDPFSFLVRSLGLSILPATNYGLQAFLSATGTKSVGNCAANWSGTALRSGRDAAQFQAALFPPRRLAGRALHLHHCAEFSNHAVLVPRHLSAGSAAGADLPLVGAGAGERIREMQ